MPYKIILVLSGSQTLDILLLETVLGAKPRTISTLKSGLSPVKIALGAKPWTYWEPNLGHRSENHS